MQIILNGENFIISKKEERNMSMHVSLNFGGEYNRGDTYFSYYFFMICLKIY